MSKHIRLAIEDDGFDIYAPRTVQTWGYRYGPSIMVHNPNDIDAWFASPGAAGEADWFTYKHSTDGGQTWSNEKVVLTPTADSMDWFSVCDPAVVKFGGYYYIGYTSTIFANGGGVCNNAFVARSENPDGPFYKWTGKGWGETRGVCRWMGKPAPVIYYDEPWQNWGAGEFSFTVVGNTLYAYYTWTSKRADGAPVGQTRVATADIRDENWPAHMHDEGIAYERTAEATDSSDVVYCDEMQKFVILTTEKRFSPESRLAVYESDDGLRFTRVQGLRTHTGFKCHNCGISGDELHHIHKGDLMLLGYAYGDKWGYWGTRFHRYTFTECDTPDESDNEQPNVARPVEPWQMPENPWSIAISTLPHFYRTHRSESFTVVLRAFDTTYANTAVRDDVVFDNYDPSIVSFSGMTCKPCGIGYTYVDAHWGGRRVEFLVYVYPDGFALAGNNKTVKSFIPLISSYTVRMEKGEVKQIRGLRTYADETWFELCGTDGVTYEVEDTAVLTVNEEGNILPRSLGFTKVTASCGGKSFTVTVTVV